ARRAKVSKASIYKRWRSRAELLHDVSRTGMAVPIEDPDTGSVQGDVEAILGSLSQRLRDPRFSAVVIAVVDEAGRDESIADLGTALSKRGRDLLIAALSKGVDRGELPASTDVEQTALLLTSPLFYARYHQRAPLDDEAVAALVQRVLALA
ncbi:MAG: TetR-like C-terminal domain-containing protein, partial [Microthrixaceae bacterium]